MSNADGQLTQSFDEFPKDDESQPEANIESSQPRVPENVGNQVSNMFSGASHVSIEGESTLSSIGGSVYNISPVLSLAIGLETSPTQIAPTSPPRAQGSSPGVPSANLRVEREPEHDSEVYARLLLPKCLGWPLWLPRPRGTLPEAYRTRGVDIGDVGIITADGEFDYFFNICLPADHPINRSKVPDNFEPLDIALTGEDVSFDPHAWPSGSHILNGGFKEKETSQGSQFQFEGSAPAGALLVSPLGGSRRDYLNLNVFVTYIKTHGQDWYRYINGPRGRRATNGSVYLVTGVDRTKAWGTSSFSGLSGEGSFPLRFEEHLDRSTDPFPFTWIPSGYAATRHGPAFENETRRGHPLPENQCIFLRGFRVALGDGLWASLFKTVQVEATSILQSSPASLLKNSPYIPFGVRDSAGGGGLLSYFGTQKAGGSSQSSKTKASSDEDVSVISDLRTPSMLHPSDIINRRLLDIFQDATMAITHDSVWCSILWQGETSVPEPGELIKRVEVKFNARFTNGLAQYHVSPSLFLEYGAALQPFYTPVSYSSDASDTTLVEPSLSGPSSPGSILQPLGISPTKFSKDVFDNAGASSAILAKPSLSRSSAEGTSSGSSSSKTTLPVVCKRCRRQKIRCDRLMPCGSCLRAGQSLCEYEDRKHPRSLDSAFISQAQVSSLSRGVACVPCKRRKVKCDAEAPCGQCKRRGAVCEYPNDQKNQTVQLDSNIRGRSRSPMRRQDDPHSLYVRARSDSPNAM